MAKPFDFITPDDMQELAEAFNAAMKDHEEAHAWARITLSREDFHRQVWHIDYEEGRG